MANPERSVESPATDTANLFFGNECGNYFRINEDIELGISFDQGNQPLVAHKSKDTPIQLIDKEGTITTPAEPVVEFNPQTHNVMIIDGIYCLKFLTPPQRTNQGDSIARVQISWPQGEIPVQISGS